MPGVIARRSVNIIAPIPYELMVLCIFIAVPIMGILIELGMLFRRLVGTLLSTLGGAF
jgi:hypothetical protein